MTYRVVLEHVDLKGQSLYKRDPGWAYHVLEVNEGAGSQRNTMDGA